MEYKMCFVFSTSLSKTIVISRRTERDIVKNVYWSTRKVQVHVFLAIIFQRKLTFLKTFSKKKSNIQFHLNSSSGSAIALGGQTDRWT